MLSYRHGFHAGNHADVLKHAVYVFVARYMQGKNAGMLFLDTHAGAGTYDLSAPEAEKTGEFRAGIRRMLTWPDPPPLVAGYAALVRAHSGGEGPDTYPGSPALAAALARPQDRVVLYELHPTDFARLQGWARAHDRIAVHRADGLAALRAHLPPRERRALAIVDPSYEIKSDYEAAIGALIAAVRRFPGGVYMLWYPVIERTRVTSMEAALRASKLRRIFRMELCVAPDSPGRGMTGSGVLIVNPPFTLPQAAETGLPWLAAALGACGAHVAEWLAPE